MQLSIHFNEPCSGPVQRRDGLEVVEIGVGLGEFDERIVQTFEPVGFCAVDPWLGPPETGRCEVHLSYWVSIPGVFSMDGNGVTGPGAVAVKELV